MLDWKRKLAIVAVPALLAVGATAVVASANGSSSGSPSHAATLLAATAPPSTATEAPETAAETAAEKAEPNEPALPGGGNADPAGQADHQFDGVE